MRRTHFLPIVSAAVLVAAACSRAGAQDNAAYPVSTRNVSRRVAAPAAVRPAAAPMEQTAGPAPPAAPATHHKSWKDLPRTKSDGKSDKPSVGLSPWSAAGALAVVVGLILVLARLFRRHAPIFSQSLPQEALEILGRRYVDPRQTILLVRIGARVLVVGSSANGLNSLGQIDDPVEVDLLAGMCRRGPHGGIVGTSFFKLLKGEAASRPAAAADRASQTACRAAGRAPIVDSRWESQPPGPSAEGLSQPEYDLVRRLRGVPAPLHAGPTEGPS